MAERLKSIVQHIVPGKTSRAQLLEKHPDDIVITYATRTPLTKAGKGGLKDSPLDSILYKILEAVKLRMGFDPQLVEDIACGNVSNAKAAYYVRAAALAAGFPNTTAAYSVNRFCSSGLKAIEDIANAIKAGDIEIGIALGAESMSEGGDRLARPFVDEIMAHEEAATCLWPMGQTSEEVGRQFEISRESQDRYAAESYKRAEIAQKAGWFDDEITPIKAKVKDPKTGEEKEVLLTKDEGIRAGTTYESLAKIRPAFPDYGNRSTGGNSSQVTDGAAAVVLMKRSRAMEIGLPVMAKFVSATVAGLAPRIMGIGPSIVIPKLLKKHNLTLDDIDLIELNEAFASMAVYCRDTLKIDWEIMNVRGGAIALGHPLGCTGARQLVTILSEARRQKKQVLLTSMCVGTGQGMAGLFVNEQI